MQLYLAIDASMQVAARAINHLNYRLMIRVDQTQTWVYYRQSWKSLCTNLSWNALSDAKTRIKRSLMAPESRAARSKKSPEKKLKTPASVTFKKSLTTSKLAESGRKLRQEHADVAKPFPWRAAHG